MTHAPLRIAYGDEPSQRADVLLETLRAQGHEVLAIADREGFLSTPEPDLYVIGRALADRSSGLDVLAAIRGVGRSAPVILLEERPSFDEMRRAVELGANDVVLHPLEAGALGAAIERATAASPKPAHLPVESVPPSCERSYPIDESCVGRAAREACAFLVNEGVANAHRVRIATALAELVDNACRHAYAQGTRSSKGSASSAEVRVRIEIHGARVRLAVSDRGRGFDVSRARLERVPAALPHSSATQACASSSNGLGRVERLCEGHDIVSGKDGTRVELTFELTPVRFDEEPEHLAETDFLDPARARSLIAALRKGRPDLSGVPPALALTIGRIIGGLDADVRSPRR